MHNISTSDPVFYLGLSVPTILMFGKAVKWALDTWKQVEEIRKVRAEAQKIRAFTEKEIKDTFDGKIEDSIKTAIEKQIKELLPDNSSRDTGRLNELRNDLSWALDSVLTRVERGMTVEIRFLPPTKTDETGQTENDRQFDALNKITPELIFPPSDPSPIRPLPPPEPPSTK